MVERNCASELRRKYFSLLQNVPEENLRTLEFIVMNEKLKTLNAADNMPDLKSVAPYDLESINGYSDGLQNSYFNWKWLQREDYRFKVLTIENQNEAICLGPPRFRPVDLIAKDDFYEGIETCFFCWRYFETDSGYRLKVVTIENLQNSVPKLLFPLRRFITPNHLLAVPNFYDGLSTEVFQWRWFERENEAYRVVTLENK
ncbi:unnamed protein product [Blepharisma stoltei]|uniref:Uncharacterized protein n=1 Tax=Blepharisma stoltei TaxID=1481888 RepID=A0AAU9KDZ1_9CILI|nr:unnamed protein product [Blepharisma stoltei]